MKYLDYPELETLSRNLTFESAECKVFTRLEAYSCKAVKRERQLFKTLESQYLQSASLSPPKHLDETLASPFGRLDQLQARKTLFLLIATLNGAFPDHDFSSVDPGDFRREANPDSVLNSLGTTLLSLRSNSNAPRTFSSFPSSYDNEERQISSGGLGIGRGRQALNLSGGTITNPHLASVLDDIMCISDCEVYTFHPDTDSDPHASAEPDEEGVEPDDERYADDESWSGEDDEDADGGNDTQMSTPRRHSLTGEMSFHEDAGMDDAPMFDEDLMGFGFTPVHSRVSSTVTTPRTPSSARTRAGDFFSSKKVASGVGSRPYHLAGHVSHRLASSSAPAFAHQVSARMQSYASSGSHNTSASAYSDEEVDDSFDDGQGPNGLLWATYAFFYNRKLKRILFVSVWSRRSNAASISYGFSPPTYASLSRSSEAQIPSLSIDQAMFSSQYQNDGRGSTNTAAAKSLPAHVQRGTLATMVASPAKRAIARSTGDMASKSPRTAGTKRRRDVSASPAPSSRSPFPHDSQHV